jgi:hypothetical protein
VSVKCQHCGAIDGYGCEVGRKADCPLLLAGSLDDWHHEDVPDHLCPATGTYCTGQFCGDYGCAKEAGFWDEADDET